MKKLQDRLVELAGLDRQRLDESVDDTLTETRLRNIIRKEIREMLEKMESTDYDAKRTTLNGTPRKRKTLGSVNSPASRENTTVVGFLGPGFR